LKEKENGIALLKGLKPNLLNGMVQAHITIQAYASDEGANLPIGVVP